MGKRHDAIGIKQTIRFEWMQMAANLLLSGLDANTIRQELHEFLSGQKCNGSEGVRSDKTRTFVVNNLMRIWVSPDPDLVIFRDASLSFIHEHPSMELAVHWGIISAAYPFWFSVAQHMGRLLNLQNQVTQDQIMTRLKEQYGDRQTVSRYARFVIRSFVVWGALKDSDVKGCYQNALPIIISNQKLTILMFEAILHAIPEGKMPLALLINNPALFPFQLPVITGDFVSQQKNRIDVVRYGLDDELLLLCNPIPHIVN